MSGVHPQHLYLDDFYRTSTEGVVVDAACDARGPYVCLDRNLFYPQGGGQKGDRGKLVVEDSGSVLDVCDTRKDKGEIRLYLSPAIAETELRTVEGGSVVQEINWPYRYIQMKLHSTAHFLHCTLERFIGEKLPYPARAPLSEDGGECHYEFVDKFDSAILEKATAAMNSYMAEGHEITTHPEEEHGPGYRSWRCENDYILCGGLHPRNSREIGLVDTGMRQKRGKTILTFWLVAS